MSVEETVKKIVTRITRKSDADFSTDATFEGLNADSLDIVQILVAVEDAFDIEVQDEELQELSNMGDFITYIESKIAEKK